MARTAAVMTVAQARRAIGEAISARIVELFETDFARMRASGTDKVYARTWRGFSLPGHNPSAVPPVPTALVATDPAWTTSGVIFTRPCGLARSVDCGAVLLARVSRSRLSVSSHQGRLCHSASGMRPSEASPQLSAQAWPTNTGRLSTTSPARWARRTTPSSSQASSP